MIIFVTLGSLYRIFIKIQKHFFSTWGKEHRANISCHDLLIECIGMCVYVHVRASMYTRVREQASSRVWQCHNDNCNSTIDLYEVQIRKIADSAGLLFFPAGFLLREESTRTTWLLYNMLDVYGSAYIFVLRVFQFYLYP